MSFTSVNLAPFHVSWKRMQPSVSTGIMMPVLPKGTLGTLPLEGSRISEYFSSRLASTASVLVPPLKTAECTAEYALYMRP
jgi:hypothetical protein